MDRWKNLLNNYLNCYYFEDILLSSFFSFALSIVLSINSCQFKIILSEMYFKKLIFKKSYTPNNFKTKLI